jgi:hypothetical protein
MKQDKVASADENGSSSMTYAKDSVHDMNSEWQMKLATNFINNNRAESVSTETTNLFFLSKNTSSFKFKALGNFLVSF